MGGGGGIPPNVTGNGGGGFLPSFRATAEEEVSLHVMQVKGGGGGIARSLLTSFHSSPDTGLSRFKLAIRVDSYVSVSSSIH